MSAGADLFVREHGEPALLGIDPGGTGGREVRVKTRAVRNPLADRGRFVNVVVVRDQMDVERSRHGLLYGIETVVRLAAATAAMTVPN
jgi:hypothetical protein